MAHRDLIRIDERVFPRLMNILRAKGFSEEELKQAIAAVREFLKRQSIDSPEPRRESEAA